MGWNLPDDWGLYYRTCERCGATYHASEWGCEACADWPVTCEDCGEDYDPADHDECPHCAAVGEDND